MNILESIKRRILIKHSPERYHLWHYNSKIWTRTTWMGIKTEKLPLDTWNYQEILFELKPSLVVEFGTRFGGSALYFATVMRGIGSPFRVLSVDIDHDQTSAKTKADPDVELFTRSSADPLVTQKIAELRDRFPGPVFAILDSDHSKAHVLGEMMVIRPVLRSGDYVIVEDSNVNGHPVFPNHGPGPYEAIEEYFSSYPNDYAHDTERETKFGLTWAPNGYLIRK
jgi:cephalosporin hydroxylase